MPLSLSEGTLMAVVVAVVLLVLIAVSVSVTLAIGHHQRKVDHFCDELVKEVTIEDLVEASWPERFRWGVATAAFQNEGFHRKDSTWSLWSRYHCPESSDLACGAWKFFEDADVPHAKWMGCNAFRLSVDWARIMPTPETVDRAALQRYVRMVDACNMSGIEVNVTLLHFNMPLWVPRTGWADPLAAASIVEPFGRFARIVAEALRGRVRMFTTINEPVIDCINCYMRGSRWPGIKSVRDTLTAIKNVWLAHNAAWASLKRVIPDCMVGIAKNVAVFRARSLWSPLDQLIKRGFNDFYNYAFLDGCMTGRLRLSLGGGAFAESADGPARSLDYVGVNHYNVAFAGLKASGDVTVDMAAPEAEEIHPMMGWEMRPSSMFRALVTMWGRYRLPILVTEAGCPDAEALQDDSRCRHLLNTIYCLHAAIETGIDVRGLYVWTLHDNLEWEERVPFGLWHTDFGAVRDAVIGNRPIQDAFKPRASAYLYRRIAKGNCGDNDGDDDDAATVASGVSIASYSSSRRKRRAR